MTAQLAAPAAHRCPTCGAARVPSRVVEAGPLVIDLDERTVRVDGALVTLTPNEWVVLAVLAERHGVTVPMRRIAAGIARGAPVECFSDHNVRVVITRLRGKLAPHGAWVANRPTFGYALFRPTPEEPTPPPVAISRNEPLRGRWSLDHEACRCCNQSDAGHQGRGICTRCKSHADRTVPPACTRGLPSGFPWALDGRWALEHEACRCCGKTDARHHGRGLCSSCSTHAAAGVPDRCNRRGVAS